MSEKQTQSPGEVEPLFLALCLYADCSPVKDDDSLSATSLAAMQYAVCVSKGMGLSFDTFLLSVHMMWDAFDPEG